MHAVGISLLDDFLKLPYQPVRELVGHFPDTQVRMADFSRLPVRTRFIAMMPQWDFLNFMADQARIFPNFQLLMQTEATGLVRDGDRIEGITAQGPDGPIEIRATLTVAADGRDSTLRDAAGLSAEELGGPLDVLWFRLSRHAGDTDQTQAQIAPGRIFIMLNRGDYWQRAFVISKGTNESVRNAGLAAFRQSLRPLLPIDPSRSEEIQDWDQVKLLAVKLLAVNLNRLNQWR